MQDVEQTTLNEAEIEAADPTQTAQEAETEQPEAAAEMVSAELLAAAEV